MGTISGPIYAEDLSTFERSEALVSQLQKLFDEVPCADVVRVYEQFETGGALRLSGKDVSIASYLFGVGAALSPLVSDPIVAVVEACSCDESNLQYWSEFFGHTINDISCPKSLGAAARSPVSNWLEQLADEPWEFQFLLGDWRPSCKPAEMDEYELQDICEPVVEAAIDDLESHFVLEPRWRPTPQGRWDP